MVHRRQNLEHHPCYGIFRIPLGAFSDPDVALSHASGGFGGTCVRCGTEIEGPNNMRTGPLSWSPIEPPTPFQPGSVERMIYDTIRESGATIHVGWCEKLAEQIADKIKEPVA